MKIGVPKEIKNQEHRVGLSPASVGELVRGGHAVLVETGAGEAIGFTDDDYRATGAAIAETAEEVFTGAGLIVKVKEPQEQERAWLKAGQILFTYLHLAPDPVQTEGLLASGITAVAYETVTDAQGHLPLLTPMSEVAGRLSIQAGARCLEMESGGRGVLLGGVAGTPRARVAILGGGVVGTHAAGVAAGMGADVVIIDKALPRLRALESLFGGRVTCLYATGDVIAREVTAADLVIGAILQPGASAPKLVTREMIRSMPNGAAVVDVSIDQGGCIATSHPTTHDDPTFIVDGVVHYCVANMPGVVARTATLALNNATLPFVRLLAEKGLDALRADPHLRNGLNVHRGRLTNLAVARDQDRPFAEPLEALGA
jgi:alanine dehydrogenase